MRPLWLVRLLHCPVEVWSAMAAIVWSKYLLWFGSSLDSNPNYAVALRILPEGWWEVAAFAAGCLQLAAVAAGHRWLRLTAGLLAAFVWLLLGLAFLLSGNGAPSCALYGAWAGVNIHSAVRAWCGRGGRSFKPRGDTP